MENEKEDEKYSITSLYNWKEFVNNEGDNRYLNDVDVSELKKGDRIVIAWIGGEREIEIG